MAEAWFDVLTTTASELQSMLAEGRITSAGLVDVYLREIEEHNDYLKAVIATAPRADLVSRARILDDERSRGSLRSPLHGIPILIKDNIGTHPDLGMPTTAGTLGLLGSRPKKSADVVENLTRAGLLIIGKANLSELSYYKGEKLLCGWSAVGGQCQSAYVKGGIREDDTFAGHSNPGGSSAGSAVCVSAGFAPLSLGTETDGSLIMPASRAALYTIKPTIGLVSQQGVVPISSLCDAVGPMTKSVVDLARLLDILVDPSTTTVPHGGYAASMMTSWADLKIGVLNVEHWKTSPDEVKPEASATEQMTKAYREAYAKIKSMAKSFHADVPLMDVEALKLDGEITLHTLWRGHFRRDFENYLSGIESSPVHSLQELVHFHEEHADKELPPAYPNQVRLQEALDHKLTQQDLEAALKHARLVGREQGIDKILKEYDVDVIIGPADSDMSSLASASGYPIASLPLGYLDVNGRPFAMAALASAHQEAVLIKVQSAWEAAFGPRQPPPRANF